MATGTDWLPKRREEQIVMARGWISGARANKIVWGIPSVEIDKLEDVTNEATNALEEAMSNSRTPAITAHCKAAFEALTAKMRFFKSHYFLSPPLTEENLVSLGLKPQNPPTPIPAPKTQAEADISRPGVHLLELHLRPVSSSVSDPHRSDYGYRVYYGIMPQGGASVEVAASMKRELMQVPVSGTELPFSKFTRRKKELFDFAQEDSGKTAYFCVCYENAKGDSGPWGPIFSAVIP
jgi:hypothetical protein